MKRMVNVKKRKCEWSGEEVLHDFASVAHNLPLLPKPMPMELYLFNKYEKVETKQTLQSSDEYMLSNGDNSSYRHNRSCIDDSVA